MDERVFSKVGVFRESRVFSNQSVVLGGVCWHECLGRASRDGILGKWSVLVWWRVLERWRVFRKQSGLHEEVFSSRLFSNRENICNTHFRNSCVKSRVEGINCNTAKETGVLPFS